MAKYFTGTGDDGYTSTLGKDRIPKFHLLMEAIGTIDEASAALGIARSVCQFPPTLPVILVIQRDLYKMMTEIAAEKENANRFHAIDDERILWLEQQIDFYQQKIEKPKGFIVPGDTYSGSVIDLARTIIRRGERRVAELLHQGLIENKTILKYLNRLSSLCFLLEFWENKATTAGSSQTMAKGDSLGE